MKSLHLPEFHRLASIRLTKVLIWIAIIVFLWIGIQMASDPHRFFSSLVEILRHILPD